MSEEVENAIKNRFGNEYFDRLKNSKCAVAGLGGLGSNIAVSLARCGVGELFLVDFDTVDVSNLNRQQYDFSDIGSFKTEALAQKIYRINPHIKIKYKTVRITPENTYELFKNYSIICEALDNPTAKAEFTSNILSQIPTATVISGNGMAGINTANSIKTSRVLDRLYVCGDGISDVSNDGALTAPRVAICANHQANAALLLMLGKEII